ncbi:unnamed protein product [Oikopleura dioica]|uniref:Uncharacterized protein n=1 Tax=Oikopleura dioica TaxID=34765 RepID=E4YL73_OIKDI|nr:unnamed protein product [Oikopleura dioica]
METIFRPDVNLETLSDALQNVDNDLKYLKYELIRDKEILDLACQAGFRGNTIGLQRMMPEESVAKCTNAENIQIWGEHLLAHRKGSYLQSPPSFVGIGVTPDELENAVKNSIHVMENPTWGESAKEGRKKYLSQWTGGFVHQNEEAVNSFSIGEEISESYFCMSWEAPSYNSKERATAHVLRALLGGGRSFESGGAGKGLTTILYRVLGSLVGQNFSAFKAFLPRV